MRPFGLILILVSCLLPAGIASAQESVIYTVQYGDTLQSIAAQYPGVTADDIAIANDMPQWGYIWVGQALNIPQPTEAAAEETAPATADVVYTTQTGDTLSDIAARFEVEVADIVAANDLANPNQIAADQTLVIPSVRLGTGGAEPLPLGRGGPVAPTYAVRGNETLADIAARFGVSETALAQANGITDPDQVNYIRLLAIPEMGQGGYTEPESAAAAQPAALRYTVQYGDTLAGIAAQFGIDAAEIARANGLTDFNHIEYAQELLIPGAAAPEAPGSAGLQEGQGGFTETETTPTPPATGGPVGAAPTTEVVVRQPILYQPIVYQPYTAPYYTVRTGDTLAGIAARFGATTAALAAANGIANSSYIQIGQVLTIPAAGGPVYPVPQPTYYTVRTGDTLAGIAARFGATTAALAAANGVANPSYIQIGQVLAIP